MSEPFFAAQSEPLVRADGCIQWGGTVIAPWPSLRMSPRRTTALAQEILWSQRGDRLWSFTARIPSALLKLVRAAQTDAWELLELAAAAPERGCELIRQNPALALLLARSAPVNCGELAAYYCRLLDLTWRQALGAIGLPAKRRFVRVLRKLSLANCQTQTLDALAEALRQRHPHLRILSHLPRITRDTVALLSFPATWINARLLLRSAASPDGEMSVFWCLEAVSWLRELEEPARPWPYGRLGPDELARVETRLRERLGGHCEQTVPFPAPPFPDVPGRIAALRNYWAVVAEGNEQDNCAAHFVGEILSGDCYLYAVTAGEHATLLLRRVGESSRWVVADLRLERNREASDATWRCVRQWLRAHSN